MQQLGVRLWKEDRQQRSEGSPELAFSGQRIPNGPPRKRTVPEHRPGTQAPGIRGGQGQLGAEGSQHCSKWQHQKQTLSLTYPVRLRQSGASDRALRRHKGTMEKLFQSEPAAGRRDSAAGPCSGARLSSPAGASAHSGFAAPSGAVAGAISKSFQEVSGPPHTASCLRAARRRSSAPRARPPAALPGRPGAFCVSATRRAPPGGVEPEAALAARGGRTGSCC